MLHFCSNTVGLGFSVFWELSYYFTKLQVQHFDDYLRRYWLSENQEYFLKLTAVCVAAGGDFPPRGKSRIKATTAICWYLTGTVKTD